MIFAESCFGVLSMHINHKTHTPNIYIYIFDTKNTLNKKSNDSKLKSECVKMLLLNLQIFGVWSDWSLFADGRNFRVDWVERVYHGTLTSVGARV